MKQLKIWKEGKIAKRKGNRDSNFQLNIAVNLMKL